jgi:3-isopropylmalate dehydrogenase
MGAFVEHKERLGDPVVERPRPASRSVPKRWVDCLDAPKLEANRRGAPVDVGVLWGEGVGQEVIAAGLEVLESVVGPRSVALNVYEAGRLDGRAVKAKSNRPLTDDILGLCEQTFARGGAVIQGPYGGRFVYDLRKHFDLFFKISPLQSALSAEDASLLKPEVVKGLDILITRENCGGIYQGQWSEDGSVPGRRVARHHFDYEESQVRRFLRASARLAKQRRGKMTVVWKESGLPSISALWRDCAVEAAEEFGVDMQLVGIDLMAYWLLQRASTFDVIATPNLFGDVIADLGAILLGSRGASFSGNYSEDGKSVYQTNHGAGQGKPRRTDFRFLHDVARDIRALRRGRCHGRGRAFGMARGLAYRGCRHLRLPRSGHARNGTPYCRACRGDHGDARRPFCRQGVS